MSVYVAGDIPTLSDDLTDSDSYEILAALHSGYAYSEQWRKIVLAGCREVVRAESALNNQKLSEARIDDLARLHPSYIGFLERHLASRIRWERAFLAQGGMR